MEARLTEAIRLFLLYHCTQSLLGLLSVIHTYMDSQVSLFQFEQLSKMSISFDIE